MSGHDAFSPGRPRARSRISARGAEGGSPGTGRSPTSLAAHDLLGNAVVRAALAGETLGGLGTDLRTAMRDAVAGVATPLPGQVSNAEMLRRMRHARGEGGGDAAIPTGGGRPLPDVVRRRMEAAFGQDFGDVRIHDDAAAARAAEDLNAHAFAVGDHIWFGSGEFAPGTPGGDRLIAHELTHVVQQRQGKLSGQSGVSEPTDPAEREAYANEGRILARLAAVDAAMPAPPGDDAGASGGSSTYAGPPTRRMRDAEEREAPRSAPVEEPVVPEALPPEPTGDGGGSSGGALVQGDATSPEIPDGAPGMLAIPTSSAEGAPGAVVPPLEVRPPEARVAPGVEGLDIPIPDLVEPSEWVARAREEGAARAVEIAAAAAAAVEAVRVAAQEFVDRVRATLRAQRARLEAAAAQAHATVAAARDAARATVDAQADRDRARVDAGLDAAIARVRAGTGQARTEVEAVVEGEVRRLRAASSDQVARAEALVDGTPGAGDPPLAEAQADMARQVAGSVAEHAAQAAEAAETPLRTASAGWTEAVALLEDQACSVLEGARQAAHAALETTRREARAGIDAKAEEADREIDARVAEVRTALDEREAQVEAWVAAEADGAVAAIEEHADAWALAVGDGFEQLAIGYEQGARDFDAALAEAGVEVSEDDRRAAAEACAAELARVWVEHGAPLQSESARAVQQLGLQATEFTAGFERVDAEVQAAAPALVDEAVAAIERLGAMFAEAGAVIGNGAGEAMSAGVDEVLAEGARATDEHTASLAAFVDEARTSSAGAVDEQIAGQDARIVEAGTLIGEGSQRLASEYGALKAEAESKRGEGSPAVQRGWLGDLWDWFADLGDAILEWFQEKLGRVLGNIVGHILRTLVLTAGLLVSGLAWLGAQVVNLVWGFVWGETAIPGYGGGFFAFIGDLVAGVLVYGDVRDIVKYLIIRPLMGEGPWWFNLLMVGIAVIGIIPLVGDTLKAIVKALIKKGLKSALKRLAKELGEELAERLVRELGEEAAEELLEKLGKETLERLARDLAPEAIQQLTEELGEQTLKRLAQELSGTAIRSLADDLGAEALQKLARTLGGRAIQDLNEQLGAAAVKNLLEGLRGVTIKEYLDALGSRSLGNLARELDGYAVKELFDGIGPTALKNLSDDLGGDAVRRLVASLGDDAARELGQEFTGTAAQRLVAQLGRNAIRDLGSKALKEIGLHLTPSEIRDWIADMGVARVRHVAETYGGDAMKHYGQAWMKAYKGITNHTQQHVVIGDGIKKSGVSGCHDTDRFVTNYVNPVPRLIHVHSDTVSGSLRHFRYSLMKADGSGPKAAQHDKTTLAGLEANWDAIADQLTSALDALIRNKRFPKDPGAGPPVSASGHTWNFFFRNDEIATIFPVIATP